MTPQPTSSAVQRSHQLLSERSPWVSLGALLAGLSVVLCGACISHSPAHPASNASQPASVFNARPLTFENPILPGDHPDMNLYREGGDFYLTGSSFNGSPYVEILHSTDLLHWERVSRVVDANWPGLAASSSGGGTWGGFIVKFSGGYRVYFAANFNQYFSTAKNLAGPWSPPVPLNSFPYRTPDGSATFNRGNGYDNSGFVDDDGTTYLVAKGGQCKWNGKQGGAENNFGLNLLVRIDPATGMLDPGRVIDLSFVNWNVENAGCGDPANDPQHSDTSHWAEGPTLMKRNGFYYYFASTHTDCGGKQAVWRATKLSATASDWTPLGDFMVGEAPFTGAQHSAAPFQLEDGTWWTFSHSYECRGGRRGLGRQGLLSEVTWVNDVPRSKPASAPARAPALPQSRVPFLLPVNDDFSKANLALAWGFYGAMPRDRYSLTERAGHLRIKPARGETRRVLQKDALPASVLVTRVELSSTQQAASAGLTVVNSVQPETDLLKMPTWNTPASIELSLARVRDQGERIRFNYRVTKPTLNDAKTAYTSVKDSSRAQDVAAPAQASVWLKLVRAQHMASAWFSLDRVHWSPVGQAIDVRELDDSSGLGNGWVGNHVGVFAHNDSADFDAFTYRDGFTELAATYYNQQVGARREAAAAAGIAGAEVLGDLDAGDWAMFGSLDLGTGEFSARGIEMKYTSSAPPRSEPAELEIWLDPFAGGGRIATCALPASDPPGRFSLARCALRASGSHDVYVRVSRASSKLQLVSLRFSAAE